MVGAQDLDKADRGAEDLRLEECLEAVGLDYLLGRCISDHFGRLHTSWPGDP